MDVRAGRWLRIWRDESKPLKTNASGACLTYHTKNTKRTNIYDNRSIFSPEVRNFNQKPSDVAIIMVRPCLPLRYAVKIIRQRTVDDSRRWGRPSKSWRYNIREWTGQSLLSKLRIADDRIWMNEWWATIAAKASIGVPQTSPERHGSWPTSGLVSFKIEKPPMSSYYDSYSLNFEWHCARYKY